MKSGILIVVFFMMMPLCFNGQIVRHEVVFHPERLAARGIVTAKIVTSGRLSGTETSYYHFDSTGRLTGIVTVPAGGTADTLLTRSVTDGRISGQQAQRHGEPRREELHYNTAGRLIMKRVFLHDTLYSTVTFDYHTGGQVASSTEVSVAGDTLRTAQYVYAFGELTRIDYRGAAYGSIQYHRQRSQSVTRVFCPEGELSMTRLAKYRKDQLLQEETVSVPGIMASATTRYRYIRGLLRVVRHPDGRRSRVRYIRNNS